MAKVSSPSSLDKSFSEWSSGTPEQGHSKCGSPRATCVGITWGLVETQIPMPKPAEMGQSLVVWLGILNKQNYCPRALGVPFQSLFRPACSCSQHSPGSAF